MKWRTMWRSHGTVEQRSVESTSRSRYQGLQLRPFDRSQQVHVEFFVFQAIGARDLCEQRRFADLLLCRACDFANIAARQVDVDESNVGRESRKRLGQVCPRV